MPKKDSDYSNTLIYKISCKDKTVTELYVGHTINFVQRKSAHEQNSKSNKCKLYQIIRSNGGWSNWMMEIIAFFNCTNYTEARMKEQEYFISLNANLNSIEPFPKKEEKVVEEKVVKEKKEVVSEPTNDIIQMVTSKYSCNLCHTVCSRESEWQRHILTRKHTKNIKGNSLDTNDETTQKQHICLQCNKIYVTNGGLWKHNKTCNATTQTIIKPNIDKSAIVIEDKNKLIEILIKENTEYKNIFSNLIKEIQSKKF
jgi:hypothetical protein